MILNINKEKGRTSFEIVRKIRQKLAGNKKRKVGHAGTLDPLAEGVLLILTDNDTKRQEEFMAMEKEYVCEISFGASSPTYDLEGELTYHDVKDDLGLWRDLEGLLPKYTGEIIQKVPPYSAVKVKGKPLYKKARRGEISQDQLPSRKVTVYEIEMLDHYKKNNLPTIKLKVTCSKGTYIRSLAHDLGEDLGVGGVLTGLVRTRVGRYTIDGSVKLKNVTLPSQPEPYQ